MKYLVRRLCFMAVLSAPSGFLLNLMPASPRTAGNQHQRCSYYLSAPTMCVRNSRMYLQSNAHDPKDSKKKKRSCLDYRSSLYLGSDLLSFQRLQLLQNAAARLPERRKEKRDHISPFLCFLHWLPVRHRIDFKILLLVFKALNRLSNSRATCFMFALQPER